MTPFSVSSLGTGTPLAVADLIWAEGSVYEGVVQTRELMYRIEDTRRPRPAVYSYRISSNIFRDFAVKRFERRIPSCSRSC